MNIPESLCSATTATNPAGALRAAVIELRRAGHTQSELSDWLNELLAVVRQGDLPAAAEDPILDTLDAVVGWCHPTARLFPEPTS